MIADEDARRRSFDEAAEAYDAERPGYPEALFDDLFAELAGSARVLEIGCGTGKATRSLLARGAHVVGVELGANLAAVARRHFAGAGFEVHVARFEDWEAPGAAFDLAVSAQAYHWVHPEIAGAKIARALRPGAQAAFFWNADVERVPWLDAVYDEHAPDLKYGGEAFPSVAQRIAEQRAHTERGGALEVVEVRQYPWTMRKDAAAYVRLVDTYSEHHTLPAETRARLYPAMHAAIEAHGGVIERPVVAYCLIAHPRV